MSFYRWAMRNGAGILFIAALLIFVVSFAARFFLYGQELASVMNTEGVTPPKVNIFTSFWGAIGDAASRSVWAFLGSCLLYRLDRRWTAGGGPRE
jgi:quinol-cytochrome oxidoreductase complex cytochrome b subunit